MTVTVHAFDLVTSEPLGRLEGSQISWSEALNGRMALNCRLDLGSPRTEERVPNLVTDGVGVNPVKLVIYDDSTDPPLAKSFWMVEADYEDRRFLRARCTGQWAWFGSFPLSQSFTFNNTEQFDIAATLIDWAQADEQGGGIGVETNGYTPSGVLRNRTTYNGFEYTPVGQRVDELAAVDNGFDFAIETTFDGNVTVSDLWVPSYPRAGQAWPASGVQLDADNTAVQLTVSSKLPTTDVREIGAGEGSTMLTATANDDTLAAYPPLWQVWEARKSVSRIATLRTHANRDLVLANRGREKWSATVLDVYGQLKGLTVGDECQIQVGTGDYRWPDGLEVVKRIVKRTVEVSDDGGPDRVTLELEDSDIGGS